MAALPRPGRAPVVVHVGDHRRMRPRAGRRHRRGRVHGGDSGRGGRDRVALAVPDHRDEGERSMTDFVEGIDLVEGDNITIAKTVIAGTRGDLASYEIAAVDTGIGAVLFDSTLGADAAIID